MPSVRDRLAHAWNAFRGEQTKAYNSYDINGMNYSYRPDLMRFSSASAGTLISSIYTRIAIDVASVDIMHARVDDNENFLEEIKSNLNNCLRVEANTDQSARSFIRELVLSLFGEEAIAVVPVDTTFDPSRSDSYDIRSMRTGKILEWFPKHVKVDVYNEEDGQHHQLLLEKKYVAIVENPLALVTKNNTTVSRIAEKLVMMDKLDVLASSGKLDLILQLPYVVKSELRKNQAEKRSQAIEDQLKNSTYGIAYIDGTERITQLNRPVDNNMLSQIKYLTEQLFNQLGLTEEIYKGTASEEAMLNYYNRTIEPLLAAICNEFKRKFLTKTARSQGQTIMFIRNPFKLTPIGTVAEMADRFTRNEILTSNEIRGIIGFKPSGEPQADELRNKNLNADNSGFAGAQTISPGDPEDQLAELDEADEALNDAEYEINHTDLEHAYASKYYDPQKAHEYYMRTRELKGRRTTKGLNEAGKMAAKYVHKQISEERREKTKDHGLKGQSNIKQEREKISAQNKEATEQMTDKAKALRDSIKGLPKEQRAAKREQIIAQIAQMRAQNKQKREELQAYLKGEQVKTSEDHKKVSAEYKEEADAKYDSELEKIRNTKEFQAVSKKRGRRRK